MWLRADVAVDIDSALRCVELDRWVPSVRFELTLDGI